MEEQLRKTKQQLRNIKAEPVSLQDPKSLVAVKLFYRSCMDLDAIEEDQDISIRKLTDRLGGWPVLKGPFWQHVNYTDLMKNSRNLGLPFEWFLDIKIQPSSVPLVKKLYKKTYCFR